jgi:hypothetical protein
MYSLETIIALNDETSKNASDEGLQPLIAEVDNDENVVKCPNFGYYRPKGWEETETFFVDSSGFGSESEPALSLGQFLEKVKEGYGYAITEEGQFQIYITEFKQV